METVRVRVVFEDSHILSKSKRSEGLKRTWLLLKPQLETISDLSSYLAHIYGLYYSCPNGIILSMGGFVLPPFESTRILKDQDVIRVKRKGGMLSEIVKVGDGANLIVEDEIVEKLPLVTSVPLLVNEEFEKETGGYRSQPEEEEEEEEEEEDNRSAYTLHAENSSGGNLVSKKRKASKKLQSLKKKKKRPMDPQDTENDFHIEQQESCGFHPGKSIDKKKKVSDVKSKSKAAKLPRSAERNNDIFDTLHSPKRSGKLEENDTGCVSVPQMPDGTRTVPSRSARRKKAKRQWLRELSKAETKQIATSNMQLHQMQSRVKDVHKNSIEHQQKNRKSKADNEIVADDEIVPLVIRPGHIRFEPLGMDQAVQKTQVSMETFQWNGITSKKKGQKWGKEKFPSWRIDFNGSNKERSEMTIEKVKPPSDSIDFDKLAPLAGLPKEGDVIAYRLLELSSTWTPELSPFRVGKTSWFDPQSNRILLTPVPEYPIIFEKPDEDVCAQPPDNSLYGEDGSLEIDFSLLDEVLIVKHGNSDPAKAVTDKANDSSVGNDVAISTVVPSNNDEPTHPPTPEEGEINVWDELSQALSAKKAQLIQENGWNGESSSGRSPWSYRALRSSALGPTMAILRARNDI